MRSVLQGGRLCPVKLSGNKDNMYHGVLTLLTLYTVSTQSRDVLRAPNIV